MLSFCSFILLILVWFRIKNSNLPIDRKRQLYQGEHTQELYTHTISLSRGATLKETVQSGSSLDLSRATLAEEGLDTGDPCGGED